jgi:hypothetical protein
MKDTRIPPHLDPPDVDPDAPPTADELRDAAKLREALDDASTAHDDAALARALVLAHSPHDRPLGPDENRALVEKALTESRPASRTLTLVRPSPHRRVVVTGVVSLLALAAAVLIFQRPEDTRVAFLDAPPPARARPADPLFREPFAARGGTSARIDRIAHARAGDLRDNMFARWDVR